MSPTDTMEPLYTSAPIVDYDEESHEPLDDERLHDAIGESTLGPELFDAQILAGLIAP